MIDLYLHAASEAAALDLLRPLGLAIGDAWISATPAFALDAGVPACRSRPALPCSTRRATSLPPPGSGASMRIGLAG